MFIQGRKISANSFFVFRIYFNLCTQKMCIPLYSLGIIRCLQPRGVSFFFGVPNTKCCLLQVQVLISMSVCHHIACRNERNSIYEIRRKPFVIRGFPPNSIILKFRRLFLNGCLRRCYSCDGHTVRRAWHVVEVEWSAEFHWWGFSAVLATDTHI